VTALRYVEVCAGAGGWGLGLHRAGWTGTGIELDAVAAETHRVNVGPCLTADITTASAPRPLLAALLTRALRGPALAPAHRAAGLIVRRHGYDPRSVPAGLVEAADAIREAIRARVSPDARAGVLVSVIRELLTDYPRGLALDAALVRAAAREGVALRETEAIDLLREMAE